MAFQVAAGTPTKAEIDRAKALAKALGAYEETDLAITSMVEARVDDCLNAFGHTTYCECMDVRLAPGLPFMGYVHIVTKTRNEIGYNKLSDDEKAMVDSAYEAREICVKTIYGQ